MPSAIRWLGVSLLAISRFHFGVVFLFFHRSIRAHGRRNYYNTRQSRMLLRLSLQFWSQCCPRATAASDLTDAGLQESLIQESLLID
jgi:hypothetical protein